MVIFSTQFDLDAASRQKLEGNVTTLHKLGLGRGNQHKRGPRDQFKREFTTKSEREIEREDIVHILELSDGEATKTLGGSGAFCFIT